MEHKNKLKIGYHGNLEHYFFCRKDMKILESIIQSLVNIKPNSIEYNNWEESKNKKLQHWDDIKVEKEFEEIIITFKLDDDNFHISILNDKLVFLHFYRPFIVHNELALSIVQNLINKSNISIVGFELDLSDFEISFEQIQEHLMKSKSNYPFFIKNINEDAYKSFVNKDVGAEYEVILSYINQFSNIV